MTETELPKARYLVLRDDLTDQVARGILKVGDQIPSIRELCRAYNVSSITARRAVMELMSAGVVERRRGVGLFVRRKQRSSRIALVLTGFSESSWRQNTGSFGQLVGGISSYAWERESTLTMLPLNQVSTVSHSLARFLDDQRLDGILVRAAGEVEADLIDLIQDRGIALVSIKREPIGRSVPSVVGDDRKGGFEATKHLLSLGHRNIGLIVQRSSTASAKAIIGGFRAAYETYDLRPNDDYVRNVPRPLAELGTAATISLMTGVQPPTAIVVGSDYLALGVYDAANNLGIVIPDQLSVTGFDDQDFAGRLNPSLTTVRLSYYDLGRMATELLFESIDGGSGPWPRVMDVELVIRGSTAPPNDRPGVTASPR